MLVGSSLRNLWLLTLNVPHISVYKHASILLSYNINKLDCLMYADDIVIFSISANGLQQKLKLLEKYCSDWCMKVNIKKTKVLIFNKAGLLTLNVPHISEPYSIIGLMV
jgi:hypothetical protein